MVVRTSKVKSPSVKDFTKPKSKKPYDLDAELERTKAKLRKTEMLLSVSQKIASKKT